MVEENSLSQSGVSDDENFSAVQGTDMLTMFRNDVAEQVY